jgi:hypothetical protein
MSWIFRKIFRLGPFRTTLSKKGVGMSWGIPGIRIGVSSNNKKYITLGIPGTGLYFTKFFNQNNHKSQQNIAVQEIQHDNLNSVNEKEEPWWKQKNI